MTPAAMTPREITQLLKLLAKFSNVIDRDGGISMNGRETGIISCVRQWVAWHGRDEMDMDL